VSARCGGGAGGEPVPIPRVSGAGTGIGGTERAPMTRWGRCSSSSPWSPWQPPAAYPALLLPGVARLCHRRLTVPHRLAPCSGRIASAWPESTRRSSPSAAESGDPSTSVCTPAAAGTSRRGRDEHPPRLAAEGAAGRLGLPGTLHYAVTPGARRGEVRSHRDRCPDPGASAAPVLGREGKTVGRRRPRCHRVYEALARRGQLAELGCGPSGGRVRAPSSRGSGRRSG